MRTSGKGRIQDKLRGNRPSDTQPIATLRGRPDARSRRIFAGSEELNASGNDNVPQFAEAEFPLAALITYAVQIHRRFVPFAFLAKLPLHRMRAKTAPCCMDHGAYLPGRESDPPHAQACSADTTAG